MIPYFRNIDGSVCPYCHKGRRNVYVSEDPFRASVACPNCHRAEGIIAPVSVRPKDPGRYADHVDRPGFRIVP